MKNAFILVSAFLAIVAAHKSALGQDTQTRCEPIDLRDQVAAPLSDQFFINKEGRLADSEICHAFVAANLISQKLGRAVSPDDIALRAYIDWYKTHGQSINNLSANEELDHLSGWVTEDINSLSPGGFCAKDMIDAQFSNGKSLSLEGFRKAARKNNLTFDELNLFVSEKCGEKLKTPPLKAIRILVSTVSPKAEEDSTKKLLDTIDNKLKQGSFVGYEYHSHVVTIVGLTESCEYMIQDSLTKKDWEKIPEHDPLPPYDGDYQLWTAKMLAEKMTGIDYVELDGAPKNNLQFITTIQEGPSQRSQQEVTRLNESAHGFY